MSGRSVRPPEPSVAVVIVNWNDPGATERCVRSVAAQTTPPERILVVDNGSGDDSVARLTGLRQVDEVIEAGRNLGFAGGANRGIRSALDGGAQFVWLLNDDAVARPGTLGALLGAAGPDPRIGAVGSVLLDERGRVWGWGGGRVGAWTGTVRHFRQGGREEGLTYLTAASLFLRGAALREVGLLDEGFFMYWEDVDLSVRLRAAGWRLVVAPGALVDHLRDRPRDVERMTAYFVASMIRFHRKHGAFRSLALAVALKRAKAVARGNRRGLRGIRDGTRWGREEAVPEGARERRRSRSEPRP